MVTAYTHHVHVCVCAQQYTISHRATVSLTQVFFLFFPSKIHIKCSITIPVRVRLQTPAEDISVPISAAYNHHNDATLAGADAIMERIVFQGSLISNSSTAPLLISNPSTAPPFFQNGLQAKTGFEMYFGPSTWVHGPKHVSNPA